MIQTAIDTRLTRLRRTNDGSLCATLGAAIGWVCFFSPHSFANEADAAKSALFESKIRPVLVEKCQSCHSVEARGRGKLKGGLYLDTREGLRAGGNSGPSIVVGRPEKSLLIDAIRHATDDLAMPPVEDKLPETVIADFEQWIADGAFDPREGAALQPKKWGMSIEEGKKFWSLIAPQSIPAPQLPGQSWPAGDIDRFVLSKLEEQGLTPVRDADDSSLVRRLYFDIIGLPPSIEEVGAFMRSTASNREAALTDVVERLLESPHFGERWGRHWLDAARYADSNGRDRNILFYHAWRYRDYVIDSFQRDKPYDQFIREQIAGDLLPAKDSAQQDEQRIATAFLAIGAKAFEELKPAIFRMDVIDEQIDVISRSVLGLSVSCARCHDHKFDPIPTADYYALAGILRSTQPLYGWGPRGIKTTTFHHSEWQAVGPAAAERFPAARAYYDQLQADTLAFHTARSDRYRVVRKISSAKLEVKSPGADEAKLNADIERMEAEVKEWDVKIKAMEAKLDALIDNSPPEPEWTMAVRDRQSIEDSAIHIRGETTQLGAKVPRGVLQVIALDVPATPADQSGRLQLAQWLSHPENPLTARVFVNRVWQKLFGRGLVTTPDDFGVGGARPSHPELLDHLARRFMDHGWSVKRLIRELVLARTYRLSTEKVAANAARDPDNLFLWHMAPRRLEAEVVRDAILAVSGQLNPARPARSFLSRYHARRDAELFTFKPFLTPADLVDTHRSVYLPVVRNALPEIFQLFDFASPERPVAQRDESLVPAQSLFFMNSAWVIEQSEHAARRLFTTASLNDEQRIAMLYQRALARRPTDAEIARVSAFLEGTDELLTPTKDVAIPELTPLRAARWASLCQVIFASAEFSVLR